MTRIEITTTVYIENRRHNQIFLRSKGLRNLTRWNSVPHHTYEIWRRHLRFAFRETIFWNWMMCVRLCIYTNAHTYPHPNNCLLKFHDGSHRFAIRETIFWKWMMCVRLCIYTNAHTYPHPNNCLLKFHDGSKRFVSKRWGETEKEARRSWNPNWILKLKEPVKKTTIYNLKNKSTSVILYLTTFNKTNPRHSTNILRRLSLT